MKIKGFHKIFCLIIAVVLILSTVFSLTSCKKTDPESSSQDSETLPSADSSGTSETFPGETTTLDQSGAAFGTSGDATEKTTLADEPSAPQSDDTTSVDISSYIRSESAMDIGSYKSTVSSYCLSDSAYKTAYTDEEKTQQRQKGQTMAIQMKKAINNGAHYYKVEEGVYRFSKAITPFEFSGCADLYIDISGCTFILEGTQRLIECQACKNVVFQGPAYVDRDPLPYVQFTVTSYDQNAQQLTVELMDGYTIPSSLTLIQK